MRVLHTTSPRHARTRTCDMNDRTTVRRATAGCASTRCRSQAHLLDCSIFYTSSSTSVRPLIDPRWRNPHIYRSASAKAARSSHPVPMSGTLADVGYGGEAPLMGGLCTGGARGEKGLHSTSHTTSTRARAPEIFTYIVSEPACASHTIIIFEMQHICLAASNILQSHGVNEILRFLGRGSVAGSIYTWSRSRSASCTYTSVPRRRPRSAITWSGS
eukprot:scaffold145416_cov72-Phaeocystis_antarctica.AAC.1